MPLPESQKTLHRSLLTSYRTKCALSLRGRILDCGGGLGDYLPYLRGEVTVLDLSYDALASLDHPRKVVATCEALPFVDNSFDVVWACAVVQYVHLDRFMAEARRVTVPGGRILVLVPNGRSPWDRVKRLCGLDSWWDQKGIVTHYGVGDLRPYGRVTGEVQFLPGEWLLRRFPRLGHTLMLESHVKK